MKLSPNVKFQQHRPMFKICSLARIELNCDDSWYREWLARLKENGSMDHVVGLGKHNLNWQLRPRISLARFELNYHIRSYCYSIARLVINWSPVLKFTLARVELNCNPFPRLHFSSSRVKLSFRKDRRQMRDYRCIVGLNLREREREI